MINLKPSELPADTVIKDKTHGVWMKEESGVWGETVSHCTDCAQAVRDDGTLRVWLNGHKRPIKSDDFFKDFEIISVPYSMVEYMARETSRILGGDQYETLITQTFKHHKDSK